MTRQTLFRISLLVFLGTISLAKGPKGALLAVMAAALAIPAMAVGAPDRPQAGSLTFYVAPDGNDRWSGRRAAPDAAKAEGPFATLARARNAIRELKARDGGLRHPVTVRLRGGVYPLEETLTFGPEDSGTAVCPVTYAAARGETPVLSGGRRITGWQKGEGPLWTAQVPEVASGNWYFRQLFVGGERRPRARTPNEGYLRTAGPLAPLDRSQWRADPDSRIGFRFREGDMQSWSALEDANVVVYHSWTASWHHIAALDLKARTVRFTAPSGWPMAYWENEQRYVVENVREALDAPGEWYLDRKTGVLTYWPLPGEDLHAVEVVAPRLPALVSFAGEPEGERWVEHIRLEGLSLQHTDWRLERDRPADGQAATFLGAAVLGSGMRACALEKCEIAHVGEHGVWLGRGCRENRLEQCHLRDLGAGGVYLGENVRGAVPAVRSFGNTIHNSFIHDGGHVFPAGIGVWVGQSSGNTVSHNEICDFLYSGMSLGWTWGYGPGDAKGNIVEDNHIHHLGRGVLSDMGGVYTLGVSPGTVVRRNRIHDVLSYSYGGWGLYTDEGSTGIVLENNVVYRTKSGGFHQHYGKENTVRNNIFAIASEGEIIRTREEEHISFFFERNIVCQTMGPLLGGSWGNGQFRMDRNLYWHTGGSSDLAGLSLEVWQRQTGQDRHSRVADPLFRDLENLDLRLRAGSPALRLGFRPIDLSRAGLVGPASWRSLPQKIDREPWALPPPARP